MRAYPRPPHQLGSRDSEHLPSLFLGVRGHEATTVRNHPSPVFQKNMIVELMTAFVVACSVASAAQPWAWVLRCCVPEFSSLSPAEEQGVRKERVGLHGKGVLVEDVPMMPMKHRVQRQTHHRHASTHRRPK